MALGPVKEAEAAIASATANYSVALERAPEFAQAVGVIISLFAVVEGYPPLLLERLTGLNREDSRAALGVFRAVSNRLDLLRQLIRQRPDHSPERIAFSYYNGLLAEANNIRNKYAHARYTILIHGLQSNPVFYLRTFFSDFNRKDETIVQTLGDFQKDRDRLKRIISELHALTERNEIPQGLHKQLQTQSP